MKLAALLTTCFLINSLLHAQEQQPLTPVSGERQHIAYVDPSLLRKQYDSMTLSQAQYASSWQATKSHYDSLFQQLTGEQRTASTTEYQDKLRAIHLAYNNRLQTLEKRIQSATAKVMLDKGFTSLKPIGQQPPSEQDSDITGLVLEELNQ